MRITVHFTPTNSVDCIRSSTSVSNTKKILQQIDRDPLWLLSPADMQSNTPTKASFEYM
jgi:hypothetical protein